MQPYKHFHIGQRLRDYSSVDLTVERTASGGFGSVAMGPNLGNGGQWSALKTLRPDLLAQHSPQAQQRLRTLFLREALTWCGLWPHPNLLTAQFVTEIDGQLVLVLDYAEQGSLRDVFDASQREGTWLTVASALRLTQMIAAGLVALHAPAPDLLRDFPIVHRDLKPENILLDGTNYAMITDFGLAKVVAEALTHSDAALVMESYADAGVNEQAVASRPAASGLTQLYRTQRGVALGTPAYMAPEQWEDAALAERPADTYAFGVILAEALTSRHPLIDLRKGHSIDEWRMAHATGRPIPLRKLGADVFAEQLDALPDAHSKTQMETALIRIERLLARLLAKLPHARPMLTEALAELQLAAQELGAEPYNAPNTFAHSTDHESIFWGGWANAYTRFELYDEALRRIERAYQHAPQDPAILSSYGTIMAGLRRFDDAIMRYRQALAETPDDEIRGRKIVLNQLGLALRDVKQFVESDQAYAEAIALMPDAADLWHNRAGTQAEWALAERKLNRTESARAHVTLGIEYAERAVTLSPSNPVIRQLLDALQNLRDEL